MLALAAAILGLGFFGSPPKPGPTPSAGGSDLAEVQTGLPLPSLLIRPTPTASEGLGALIDLNLVTPSSGQVTNSRLPSHISSGSLRAIGSRLFYVVSADRIETTVIGSTAGPQTLVSVLGCDAIDQLAAAGNWLAYVVIAPAGGTTTINGCIGPSKATWGVWLLDLRGGGPREVASGGPTPTALDVARFPIHLALTDSAYAFDRPTDPANPQQGTTVEVHAMSGALLWASDSKARVESLMLGGGELAVLSRAIGASTGPLDLLVADALHPLLREVARPASSASLSPDGSYLTWDVSLIDGLPSASAISEVGIEGVESGQTIFLFAPATADLLEPTRPTLVSTARGPLVAWLATAPGGSVYPAFRFPFRGGGLLESVQKPIWLDIEGNSLIWVAESADGQSAVAFDFDLSTLAFN